MAERVYVLLNSGQLKDASHPLVAADRRRPARSRYHGAGGEAAALCDQLELAQRRLVSAHDVPGRRVLHRHLLEKALETAKYDSLAQGEGLPELAARPAGGCGAVDARQTARGARSLHRLGPDEPSLKSPVTKLSRSSVWRAPRNLGQIGDAKAHLDDALGLLEGGGVQAQRRKRSPCGIAKHRTGRGDLPQAQSMLAEALTLENETGNQPALLITMSFMGELCLRLNRPERAPAVLNAAAGLSARFNRAHHALMQLGYLAIADRDAFALTSHIAELDELLERQPSERRSRIAALKLVEQHAEWSSWMSPRPFRRNPSSRGSTICAGERPGSAALLCAQKAQANRALSIVDLAVQILRRLERHDDRRAAARFSALERLESARLS